MYEHNHCACKYVCLLYFLMWYGVENILRYYSNSSQFLLSHCGWLFITSQFTIMFNSCFPVCLKILRYAVLLIWRTKRKCWQPFSGTRSCSNEDLARLQLKNVWNLVSNSLSYIVYPVVVNMWLLCVLCIRIVDPLW